MKLRARKRFRLDYIGNIYPGLICPDVIIASYNIIGARKRFRLDYIGKYLSRSYLSGCYYSHL